MRGLYYERLKTWLLVFLVLLSLVLTWFIWTYKPDLMEQDSEAVELNRIGEEKSIEDVIRPSKIVKHQFGESYMVLETDDLFHQIYETLLDADLYDINLFPPTDVTTGIEFVFPDRIPIKMFMSLFGENGEDDEMPLRGVDRILLYDDGDGVKLQVYSAADKAPFEISTTFQSSDLNRFLDDNTAVPAMAVNPTNSEAVLLNQEKIYIPAVAHEYARLQYSTDRVPRDDITQTLFPDPKTVRNYRQSNGEYTYTDGTRILNLRDDENFMTYRNSSTSDSTSSPTNSIPQTSFDYINNHNGWTNDYVLSWWRESNERESAVYRLYVNNLPVYNFKNSRDSMTISVDKSGTQTTSYIRPLLKLDPTPIDESMVELQSGESVIEKLQAAENLDLESIQDVRVGYEMIDQDNQRGLVTFEPAWYVFTDNNNSWQKVPAEGGANELE
ncbi:two-component system activity regulator YycH [Alkalihalobacillus sp. FSL R5-0424]